ncbi:hypothetical protein [Ruegeria sp. HKCCE4148]|uniref:hypothetical protein n=1 Tax=Ruegeria sp. HKCCE4148 TaxID=2794829 RepID=UPI001AE61B5E|nr:hypothetical protein [Ruegeria sp. HKCCE4148]
MNAKTKNPAGLPSKKHGMKSGKNRDNKPPKSGKAPRVPMTTDAVRRIEQSLTLDSGFVDRARKAVTQGRSKQPARQP